MRTNALALATILLVACEPEDSGRLIRGSFELYQPSLPVGIDCGEIDCVPEIRFWERCLGQPAFLLRLNGIGLSTVSVVEGELPPDVYGESLVWDENGEITRCEITLQRGEWWPEVLEHELGHCLGLAHDEQSLDLGSIMADVPWEGGGWTCTEHDVELVLEGLDE